MVRIRLKRLVAARNLGNLVILMRQRTRLLGAMLAAVTLVAPVGTLPAAHAADHHTIVLIFIRHAQSAANAAGVNRHIRAGSGYHRLGLWTGGRCGHSVEHQQV